MAPSASSPEAIHDRQDFIEPVFQVITPTGMLGYGFDEDATETLLARFSDWPTPTAMALDSGSTDSGPSKLALGTTTCPKSAYERDLRKLMILAAKYKVPVLISSAGGDGSDEHVDLFLDIMKSIADEEVNR